MDDPSGGGDHRPLQDLPQLPNIPGPRVTPQQGHHTRINGRHWPPKTGGNPGQEVGRQRLKIPGSLTQRGKGQAEAEPFRQRRQDPGITDQGFGNGGDQAYIRGPGRGFPGTLNHPLVDRPDQALLNFRRGLGQILQDHRAAVAQFQGSRGSRGTEQRRKKMAGIRRTAHGLVGRLPTGGGIMHMPGHQILAGTGLTDQGDMDPGRGGALNGGPDSIQPDPQQGRR